MSDNLSWSELKLELYRVFDDAKVTGKPDNARIKQLLERYRSQRADWEEYDLFDAQKRQGYTRNLVDAGNGQFNVLALHWHEGQTSPVHDHSGAECMMKVLTGTLKETRYHYPQSSCQPGETEQYSELIVKEILEYGKDEVAHINDTMGLHCVENPSHTEPLVSLHVYYPPYQSCKVFDERTSVAETKEMKYFSQYGKITTTEEEAKADK